MSLSVALLRGLVFIVSFGDKGAKSHVAQPSSAPDKPKRIGLNHMDTWRDSP